MLRASIVEWSHSEPLNALVCWAHQQFWMDHNHHPCGLSAITVVYSWMIAISILLCWVQRLLDESKSVSVFVEWIKCWMNHNQHPCALSASIMLNPSRLAPVCVSASTAEQNTIIVLVCCGHQLSNDRHRHPWITLCVERINNAKWITIDTLVGWMHQLLCTAEWSQSASLCVECINCWTNHN